MMQGMLGGSGSNGPDNSKVMELMQQKMLAEMFGIQENIEPARMEAEVLGTDPNGSFGVLGVRLMRPTTTQPFPRLLLETNGQLSIRPSHLKQAAAFFQSISDSLSEDFKVQQEEAKKLEGFELFGAMLKQAD